MRRVSPGQAICEPSLSHLQPRNRDGFTADDRSCIQSDKSHPAIPLASRLARTALLWASILRQPNQHYRWRLDRNARNERHDLGWRFELWFAILSNMEQKAADDRRQYP